MLDSHFTNGQQLYLLLPIAGALVAVWLQTKGCSRSAIALLTIVALLLRLFAAHLDPYLNEWDECYHALVAKNMRVAPFAPRLHWEEALPLTDDWMRAGIWLHKPPFFLWQIALSLKVFGLEPWAVRLPSAVWLSALVPVVYRMACILLNARTAFVAALFTSFAYYLEELSAAAVCNDHNDAVVIATIACGWWALLEYWQAGTWRWALLTGFFCTCAVLTKWYVGLSVLLPWAVVLLHRWKLPGEAVRFAAACALPMILAGGWLAYTIHRFPIAALAEFSSVLGHVSTNVERHPGTWFYHFEVITRLIPPFTWWLLVPAYAWLVWRVRDKEHRTLLLVLFVTIHLAFGVAQTKMVSYTLVLFPLYMIASAHALVDIVEHVIVERYRNGTLLLSGVVLSGLALDLERLQHRHTLANPPKSDQCWRQQQLGAMVSMERLAALISDPVHSVVFNIPAVHHIQFMFHTGIEAWDAPPAPEDVARLKAKGYTVFVLQDGGNPSGFPADVTLIPDTLVRYPDVGRPIY